jgi:hypothetical protein
VEYASVASSVVRKWRTLPVESSKLVTAPE